MKYRRIIRGIILTALLICTAFIVYSIVTDPIGEHNIMFMLAVLGGFIALGEDKKKEKHQGR